MGKIKGLPSLFTLIWLLMVGLILIVDQYNNDDPMQLNAIGDFLAGTMSPLALFWLVVAYYQQNEDLKLTRKEISHQVREAKLLVAETAKNGELLEKQYKKNYEPFLVCSGVGIKEITGNGMRCFVVVHNIGGKATHFWGNVKGDHDSKWNFKFSSTDMFFPNGEPKELSFLGVEDDMEISFYINFSEKNTVESLYFFTIFYKDLLGRGFEMEGHFQYGNNMKVDQNQTLPPTELKGIKKEDVFLQPATTTFQKKLS